MTQIQSLPGFRDFLPDDCARRNYVFGKWREVARRYGFVEWDGPVLEPTELYTKKSGPEIVAQLFNFTDKGEREVALRPELTPTLARVVAAHDREFKKPLKWFSIPQCFRYEKQQRGRLREHFQFNADIIGEASLDADVESIALCIDLLRAFGFGSSDVVVRINDRAAWVKFLTNGGLDNEQIVEFLHVIDKIDRRGIVETRKALEPFGVEWYDVQAMLDNSAYPEDFSPKLNTVLQRLDERGFADFVKRDFSLVRGLAYYTGVVFEAFDRGGKLRALAGGGRYDNLIHQLSDGAVSLPAIGFAMGDVVLGELINEIPAAKTQMETTIASKQDLDIYIVIAKEERRADALVQVQSLRDADYRVDYPLSPAKVGKQFQTAEQLGARVAILFGDEWPEVKIKHMSSGEQMLVPPETIALRLSEIFDPSS
ncbi:MAG: histidine--tRNA ligase [Verrucomicrobia bacterium]|nr:MAG: histidine--tRNA ligase [Verrucomicrobiota bacterium]